MTETQGPSKARHGRSGQVAARLRQWAVLYGHWLLPVAVAWVWFCTLQATSFERIRTLTVVEPYALAVYNQLAWIFAHTGSFSQTIHLGYSDDWIWSGHRAVFLPIVGWIYGLSPNPFFLCRIQIAFLAAGVIPAYVLGRMVLGEKGGGLFGILVYALYPPLALIALNDYQDLILGVPFFLGAVAASRQGRPIAFAVFAIFTCFAREEWIFMLPLIGLSVPGDLKKRGKWMLGGAAVAGVVGGLILLIGGGPDSSGHDNPMTSQVRDVFTWPIPFTRTWGEMTSFYLEFLKPVHFLALLAPLALVPMLGPLYFHLTAPADGGVDTNFTMHIHHMAPIAAWIMVAAIDGAGVLLRFSLRWKWVNKVVMGAALVAVLGASLWNFGPWLKRFDIHPQMTMAVDETEPPADPWVLVERIPADAPAATDVFASVTIASRRWAWTYDESLADKAPAQGISAVEYAMINERHDAWVKLVEGWPGVEVLDRRGPYVLYHLPPSGAETYEGLLYPEGTRMPGDHSDTPHLDYPQEPRGPQGHHGR